MAEESVDATPITSNTIYRYPQSQSNFVKSATPDIVIFNDAQIEQNAQLMIDVLFENIGGQELLTIGRQDTVNGINVLYQPIANLNIIREEYNPNNIIKLQKTSDKIFGNYPIKIDTTIPDGSELSDDAPAGITENVYLDTDNNVVIEVKNIPGNEQVEVEITRGGIIYSVNLADNG